eukprot:c48540_g1_i1 orf=439-744(+)
MAISRKGIQKWQHMWNGRAKTWWPIEVLRQRHKLMDKETQAIKDILAHIPGWFPTNMNITKGQPLEEWCWSNGESFCKTNTRTMYKILARNESWHIPLNTS